MVDLPNLQIRKLTPRVDMLPNNVRKAILQHGRTVLWEQAAPCPCGSQPIALTTSAERDTREHRVDCPGCRGTGVLYHSRQPAIALVLTPEVEPERFAPWGQMARGMVKLTLLPEHLPQFMDRFTMTDAVLLYQERRRRDPDGDAVIRLRYPVVQRDIIVGSSADPTVPETRTIGVMYARRTTVAGVLIDEAPLVEGADFELVDGALDFTGSARAPAPGAYVAVSYHANPVYIVRSVPFGYRTLPYMHKATTPKPGELAVRVDCWLEWLGGSDGAED